MLLGEPALVSGKLHALATWSRALSKDDIKSIQLYVLLIFLNVIELTFSFSNNHCFVIFQKKFNNNRFLLDGFPLDEIIVPSGAVRVFSESKMEVHPVRFIPPAIDAVSARQKFTSSSVSCLTKRDVTGLPVYPIKQDGLCKLILCFNPGRREYTQCNFLALVGCSVDHH